jgi:hypothetical protein
MSYGALIKNDNGEILIDADFKNLMQSDSGLLAAGNEYSDSGIKYVKRQWVSHPTSKLPPFFAVEAPDHYIAYESAGTPSSGNYTQLSYHQEDAGSRLNWVTHDFTGGDGDTGNWGMKVWDGSGDKVYDSREKYLVVEDVVNIPDNLDYWDGGDAVEVPGSNPPEYYWPATSVLDTTQDVTHASVANAYYILNNTRGVIGTGARPMTRAIKRVSNSKARLCWMRTDDYGFVAYKEIQPKTTLLVCSLVGG